MPQGWNAIIRGESGAIRADLRAEWSFPPPTHSFDALLWEQFQTGDYWNRHRVTKRISAKLNEQTQGRLRALNGMLIPPQHKPWKTIRDAFSTLPPLAKKRTPEEPSLTHFHIPGARSYVGHTGSPLDEPAKTLKAGVHGVPGGENTLLLPDGSVRYFSIRESARLQTFPDNFVFSGSWTESMRQIGNAVPVTLAEHLATKLKAMLSSCC